MLCEGSHPAPALPSENFHILKKSLPGCCANHFPAFLSFPKPLSASVQGSFPPWGLGGGKAAVLPHCLGFVRRRAVLVLPYALPLPTDHCHGVCCALHPGCFLLAGAQPCRDGSSVEQVMRPVTGLLTGNAHCLLVLG